MSRIPDDDREASGQAVERRLTPAPVRARHPCGVRQGGFGIGRVCGGGLAIMEDAVEEDREALVPRVGAEG